MEKILLIEDSRMLSLMIKERVELETGFKVEIAGGYGEALELLSCNDFFVSVTDLNLPDAQKGSMVDVLMEKLIPVIVYTGDYSDELRDNIWKKRIVDYIFKRDPDSDVYLAKLICQLWRNRDIDVLVVDDSNILRSSMKRLLETHLFRVHLCSSGKEGLKKVGKLSNLKLIITDYMMPDMDGFEFVRELRKSYKKDKVAIIGVSGSQSEQVSAKFIKFGANDFMMKPFSHEQFYTRVNQNLQNLHMIESIRDMSFKDYLTGLYNRRYFFMEMENVFKEEAEKTVALLDIDHFKRVNDSYGHDVGDAVLKAVSELLVSVVGSDGFVTRFGGEEFCIYMDSKKDADYFENLRAEIEELVIEFDEKTVNVTSSFGVVAKRGISIGSMISEADRLLYQAKENGRNTVFYRS